MRAARSASLTLALAAAAGALLAGCGSQTKTVSAAGAPPATQTTPAGTTASTATTPSTGHTTNGGTAASPTSTRTAPEPPFAQKEPSSEGASAAAAVVRANGYTPNDTSEYHPNQTLRVLVGTRTGSGDGYGQTAFFFVNGHYIGTDTKESSAKVRVVSQNDTAVTIAYPLYRHSDPLCCPSGGRTTVTFQLNNGKLSPTGPIPPASSTTALSRN